MTISKSTVVQNIYKEFYDILVTVTEFATIIYPAWPEKEITSKSSYPLVILNSPDVSWDPFTFTKKWLNGTISVEIYTTDAKTCDQYADKAIDKIETQRAILRTAGLSFVDMEPSSKDSIARGKIRVHIKTITFSFKYSFTKTQTW